MRILSLLVIPLGFALSVENDVFFKAKVWPILSDSCIRCHGSERQKGRLRLDSRAAVLAGGKSGPSVVIGKPDDSLLIKAVQYIDDDLKMPPKKQLSSDQIATLNDWIKRGLPWPEEKAGAEDPGNKGTDSAAPKQESSSKP